jgi:REP element-mobilizing transposase RayT
MPNHVHMIICIQGDRRQDIVNNNGGDGVNNGRKNAASTVSRMIKQWKRAISIKIGYSVWQKSFHDHIIRDENDYCRIAEYIENNPQRWTTDCFYVANDGRYANDGRRINGGRQNVAPTRE